MSICRSRSWPVQAVDSNVAAGKPFKSDRVVSFKLFAQQQTSLLSSMYTFLPQEQIYLKVKERWKKMESRLKLNYTKAVLHATHRKSPSKRGKKRLWFKARDSCENSDTAVEMPQVKRVSSKMKVADWLNDPKQKDLLHLPERRRSYDCARYNLPYEVPMVIDPTPCKQPGILKVNSSEKKKMNSRGQSRVSFGAEGENTSLDSQEMVPPTEVGKLAKTKSREQLKYTGINNIYSFEDPEACDKTGNSEASISDLSMNPLVENNIGSISDVDATGSVIVKEITEDELLTTPETEQLPIKEIVKAPRKRKSCGMKNQGSKMKCNSLRSMKGLQIDKDTEMRGGELNNKNPGNVFGEKTWAATTYARTFSRTTRTVCEKEKKKRKEEDVHFGVETNHEGHKGEIIDPMHDVNEGFEADEGKENFVRDKRGLLVGPIVRDFNEDMDFHDTLSDGSLENATELYWNQKEIKANKPQCNSMPKKNIKKQVKRISGRKRIQLSKFDNLKKRNIVSKSNKDRYDCDFDGDDDDDDDGKGELHLEEVVDKEVTDRTVRITRQNEECNGKTKNKKSLKRNSRERTAPSNDCGGTGGDNSDDEDQINKSAVKSTILKPRNKEMLLTKGGREMGSEKNTRKKNSSKYILSIRSPIKSQVLSVCQISPVRSIHCESWNGSCSDGESVPALSVTTGTNTALVEAILRMKQITSPNLFSMDEMSPKLLSPTLSGISELSSLPSASSVVKQLGTKYDLLSTVEDTIPVPEDFLFNAGKPAVEAVAPSESRIARRSTRSSRSNTVDNLLCSMFKTVSPQEKVASHAGRRFVSSNKFQRRSNFENLFKEKEIFD